MQYDLHVRSNILSFFTYKYFFSFESLHEIKRLKNNYNLWQGKYWINKKDVDFFLEEYAFRNYLFEHVVGINMNWAKKINANVYERRWNFFCNDEYPSIQTVNDKEIKQVTIFPDSRLKKKELSESTINSIRVILEKKGVEYSIAFFGKDKTGDEERKSTTYSSFDELYDILRKTDFVISCDSMPLHFANLLGIKHYVVYNEKINYRWLTPACSENSYYALSSDIIQIQDVL